PGPAASPPHSSSARSPDSSPPSAPHASHPPKPSGPSSHRVGSAGTASRRQRTPVPSRVAHRSGGHGPAFTSPRASGQRVEASRYARGPFLSLTLDDGIRLDYAEPGVEFPGQHYALLVSDDVFDRALERIKANGVPYRAGPGHAPGEINTNHGGRGVYFDDPSGHHFELITQPYGADL
ncbi:MAG TPA: VOC family protein, partial [Actinospica sp.]